MYISRFQGKVIQDSTKKNIVDPATAHIFLFSTQVTQAQLRKLLTFTQNYGIKYLKEILVNDKNAQILRK